MTTPKKGWFERNQGLITFLGYLATVIIGGISLYSSNSKSIKALDLTRDQFKYQISKDSTIKISDLKNREESNRKFRHQDSLNKHQDSINEQQLGYFRVQTQIAKLQLKNAYLIHQEQLNDNKPEFIAQEFVTDSTINKPNIIRYRVYNSGKRTANVKKITTFLWNQQKYTLINSTPINGQALEPTAYSRLFINLPEGYESKLNQFEVLLIQIFYEDNAAKGLQLSRKFLRFDQYNPIEVVQVDEKTQAAMLNYIESLKKQTKIDYLDFSFDGSRSN